MRSSRMQRQQQQSGSSWQRMCPRAQPALPARLHPLLTRPAPPAPAGHGSCVRLLRLWSQLAGQGGGGVHAAGLGYLSNALALAVTGGSEGDVQGPGECANMCVALPSSRSEARHKQHAPTAPTLRPRLRSPRGPQLQPH